MINMKKKPSKELLTFKQATTKILADKIYADYKTASKTKRIEPESFVEIWLKENLINPPASFKSSIWNTFMWHLLKDHRGINGK